MKALIGHIRLYDAARHAVFISILRSKIREIKWLHIHILPSSCKHAFCDQQSRWWPGRRVNSSSNTAALKALTRSLAARGQATAPGNVVTLP